MSTQAFRKSARADAAAYVTKDGSVIRELMHPDVHGASTGVARQSLAEATVAPGRATVLHRHAVTEEIYHVTHGAGRMTLGAATFDIGPGDTVCIPPGTPHALLNTGVAPLVVLCACTPAYSHADTELLEP
jgi:mannose-6-phosphate isomerase-like protein (cupin superfamily)